MASDFQQFGFPVWMRNIVGVIKVSLALLVIAGIWNYQYAVIGSIGIAVMMLAAVGVHIKEGDPFSKVWPALGLAVLALVLAYMANYYKFVG